MLASSDELIDSLRQKLRSFNNVLEEWRGLAEADEWKHHQSQILRLHALFAGCSKVLEVEIGEIPADTENALSGARQLRLKILQAHGFWSHYQEKLLQRKTAGPSAYLVATDEFAWRCLQPFLKVKGTGVWKPPSKSPPLVYLGQAESPFVVPRTYHNYIPHITDQVFRKMLESAPLSVISLPFYQTSYLPDTMVLGHEMGHVVDFDLGLGPALDSEIAGLELGGKDPAERLAYWQSCRVEAFADAFGTVVGGAAFLLTLGRFIASDKASITGPPAGLPPSGYVYPTEYLRVLLSYEVLKQNGAPVPVRATAFVKRWRDTYGQKHFFEKYERDLPAIATALVGAELQQLGGETVRGVAGAINEGDEGGVEAWMKKLAKRNIIQQVDARVLFAAATLTNFENPAIYLEEEVETRLLAGIAKFKSDAPRRACTINQNDRQNDEQAGQNLSNLLGGIGDS